MYITCTPGLRCPGQQQTFFLLPSPLGTRPKIQSNDVSKAILGGFGCTQLGSRRFHFEELWFYHSICSCQLPNNHLLVVDPRSGGFLGAKERLGPVAEGMHYGHPDFLDGFWASNRGSLSKASPAINLSEETAGDWIGDPQPPLNGVIMVGN